jgi:hypothetical protein
MHVRTVSLPSPAAAGRYLRPLVLALLLFLIAMLGGARTAAADTTQASILQDDTLMLNDPTTAVTQARLIGVDTIRLMMRWQLLAPRANSFRRPGFTATSPSGYSAQAWAPYDNAIRAASAAGIKIDLDLLGGAPLWATGSGMPHGSGYPFHQWEPSASAYGQFVRAVATRYSGTYDPQTRRSEPGNPSDLPRISFWSVWNEPDYGPSLAPQALPGHRGVPDSPRMYRQLADAAWSALNATGHGRDQILIGELAPRSAGPTFGVFNGMLPLVFLRGLYCVGANYRPLRGPSATELGCPGTAAGSVRFRTGNPALFQAGGFSDHPYMEWFPPNKEERNPKITDFSQIVGQFTSLATIGQLEVGLNRVLGAYGSHRKMPVWSTEFGYMTDPPKRIWKGNSSPYVSPATAAYYDNWAEYLSWKDGRVMSFDQYLLQDPLPALKSNNYGGYASGLIAYGGNPKPGYGAFRLPLYMPSQTASKPSQALEVWGAAKPAHFVEMDDPTTPESVKVLYSPQGSTTGPSVIATVAITSAEGYFDIHIRFPASGTVQLAWTYPEGELFTAPGQTVYSRAVHITVK